jgi:hypothetical protein
MVIVVIVMGAGLITELIAVMKAPVGYQDETGFHPGFEETGNDTGGHSANASQAFLNF